MPRQPSRKREGFEGQKLIVLPQKIDSGFLMKDPITRQIYITDIGYYPKAHQHYMERPHGVTQHIIIYCVEGRGWVTINKKKIDISPSHFVVIPARTPHKYGALEDDPWTIYWVHFKGDIATYVVNLITNNSQNYLPYLSYNENRIKLFEEICFNLEKGYSADNLRYVNMIFYHFLSSLLYEEKYNQAGNSQTKDPITLTIEMMQKNINRNISLNEFAAFSHLSVSHFSSLFRIRTGFSPVEYFNHLKIQHACQALAFTAKAIKEIADELGFSDQYYFSRIFSRFMGMAPSEYRNRNKTASGR
ncbi:AraC family transcriptional regulator [Pseudoflavitalea sp. X16]|uniref:AraC family transcriptional regulator n=1 Tax=Paraflavitalea devenefica TaxID=2716334 RepID=UPI00141F395A|nr:AraC family transcriptional regulator [Paraflavitalea devenefica]NII25489.1 AraC family transcriptional regulator [Paraflavitalea devenefica]